MPGFLGNASELVRKVYVLARPYGRKKLAMVTGMSLVQGLFSVLGVTSVFPFLALAADPGRLRNSNYGRKFLEWLPPMDDGQLLLFAGIFAIVMLVLSNAVNLSAEFVRNRYAYGFAHWLRTGLLRKMAARPYSIFLNENSAVTIKKVGMDVIVYTGSVFLPLLDSFARVATILLLLATLFFVQPQIALGAALIFTVFYLVVYRLLGGWRTSTSDGLNLAQIGMFTNLQHLLGGIKPAKIHRAEDFLIDKFAVYSEWQARLMSHSLLANNTPRYLIEPVAFGALVVVVLVYAARGQDLVAILPNLGVMALAGYRLMPMFQLVYSQMSQMSTWRHTMDEVYGELEAAERTLAEQGSQNGSPLDRPVRLVWEEGIRLEGVGFSYPGTKRHILRDLNLYIPKNGSLGIVGETGSGKSTLVDLILGLHEPTEGRILIDNQTLGSGSQRAWWGAIGYVPQDIYLLDDTVTANIALGLAPEEIVMDRVREAAAAAQILDFIEKDLPQGFETKVGERGVRLSGGQRQRIGLARALYHKPELLILDEATSALDNQTEAEVMKAIDALQGKITLLIVAHRLSTIEGCRERLRLSANGSALLERKQAAA